MGLGIWSMHYIGMLAFSLPVPVQYDWPTVLASLLAAIAASGVALYVVSRARMGLGKRGGRQRVHGRGHRHHALRRHGRDAVDGHVPLQSRSGDAVRCARGGDLVCGSLAALPRSRRRNRASISQKNGERGSDGRGDPGDALHGNGRIHLRARRRGPRPVPCRQRRHAGNRRHCGCHLCGAGTHPADGPVRPQVFGPHARAGNGREAVPAAVRTQPGGSPAHDSRRPHSRLQRSVCPYVWVCLARRDDRYFDEGTVLDIRRNATLSWRNWKRPMG